MIPDGNITDDCSDNSAAVSDFRVSQFENSVQYSILEVQYDDQLEREGEMIEPPPLMMNKVSKSENTNPQIVVTSTGLKKTIHKTKSEELVED